MDQCVFPVRRTTLFDFGAFFHCGRPVDVIEHDARLHGLTEIHPKKIRLETALRPNEFSLSGLESIARLKREGFLLLDGNVFQTLCENNYRMPDSWVRDTKLGSHIVKRLLGLQGRGSTTICFGGTVFGNANIPDWHVIPSFVRGEPSSSMLENEYARHYKFAVYEV